MKDTRFSYFMAGRICAAACVVFLLTGRTGAQTNEMHLVGEPQKLTSDIVAKKDIQGRFCSAVQVISDLQGLSYDSNMGVVAVDAKPGKDMVYLSPDERVLEIFCTGYAPIKIILTEIGITLKEKEVWKIEITGEKKLAEIPIVVLSKPEGATVFIDGQPLGNGRNFQVSSGKHTLRLTLDGHRPITQQIDVSESSTLFEYAFEMLEPIMVTITSNPDGAAIYIDDVNDGQTNKQLFRFPGEYKLRVSKDKYETIDQTITVSETGKNTWAFNLVKTTAILMINTTPPDAQVWINGELKSVKTLEVAPGKYRIEVKKDSWYGDSRIVTMEKGQDQTQTFTLRQMTGILQLVVEPMETQVIMKQGNQEIDTWSGSKYKKDIPVGQYTLQFSAAGYGDQTKTIMIKENETASLNVKMERTATPASRPALSSGSLDMVFVKGGTFTMGDVWGGGDGDEKPIHLVTVSDFYMGKYEVTQKQYQQIMATNPSNWKGDDLPVEQVSWYDAVEFCNKLSQKEGLSPCYSGSGNNMRCDFTKNGYRLPTEAEWEYVARSSGRDDRKWGGTNSESNLGTYAWYLSNSDSKTHPAGTRQPNDLGIFDMSGNVWEWCWDWKGSYSSSGQTNPIGPTSGSFRVLRGGCWLNYAGGCRSADRYFNAPTYRYYYLGFRLCKSGGD